jgi:uncharacterized membrane protein
MYNTSAMQRLKRKSTDTLERISIRATRWIGSTNSLLLHTTFFILSFVLFFWGVAIDKILLVVTTLVSLEAIYLSIFIQMSMNRQARRLHAVARDVEEIQEDVEEIQEDVEGIEKDVDEIQKDVEEIQEDVEGIEKDVDEIGEEIIEDEEEPVVHKDNEIVLARIEYNLGKLMSDIEELKKSKEKK